MIRSLKFGAQQIGELEKKRSEGQEPCLGGEKATVSKGSLWRWYMVAVLAVMENSTKERRSFTRGHKIVIRLSKRKGKSGTRNRKTCLPFSERSVVAIS